MEENRPGRMHHGDLVSRGPSGSTEDKATQESNVGIVGGTEEDVNGALIPKAELTLKCPLPCKLTTRSRYSA
jgi:hypothetical protein